MRLSYGPYEREGSSVPLKKTRLLFLWNARARVPTIAGDLLEKCYPLYRAFLDSQSRGFPPDQKDKYGKAPLWSEIKKSQNTSELLNRLNDWSTTHGLHADWCKEQAVRAMKAWSSNDEALLSLSWCKEAEIVRFLLIPEFYPNVRFSAEHLRELRWVAQEFGLVDFGPDDELCAQAFTPPPGLPIWWFNAVSRDEYMRDIDVTARDTIETAALLPCLDSSYKNHIIQQLKRVAADYCDSVEKSIEKEPNWKRSKRYVDHGAYLQHVVWTVMFQVEGMSYTEIAKSGSGNTQATPSISTVKRGVSEILDLIGLDTDRRREVRRGPKPGTVHSEGTKTSSEILRSLGAS